MKNLFKKTVVSIAALSMLATAALADTPATIPAEPDTEISAAAEAAAPIAPINTPYETIDGITMLPLRSIAEHFGYMVEWFDESQSVTITKGPKQISFSINEDMYALSRMAHQPLGAAPVLVNGDTTYVPINFFTELVGLNCRIAENECVSAMPIIVSVAAIEEDGSLLVNDDFYGEVIVRIGENTEIIANGESVTADMIAAEQLLAVEYGPAITMSIPPQTTAATIEILNLPVEEELEEAPEASEAVAVDVKITAVEEDGSLVVEDPVQGEVIVRIADETVITKNGEAASAEELKEGIEISVVYADYMTMSLPPQTAAVSIAIK